MNDLTSPLSSYFLHLCLRWTGCCVLVGTFLFPPLFFLFLKFLSCSKSLQFGWKGGINSPTTACRRLGRSLVFPTELISDFAFDMVAVILFFKVNSSIRAHIYIINTLIFVHICSLFNRMYHFSSNVKQLLIFSMSHLMCLVTYKQWHRTFLMKN